MDTPKRCAECREKKRNAKQNNAYSNKAERRYLLSIIFGMLILLLTGAACGSNQLYDYIRIIAPCGVILSLAVMIIPRLKKRKAPTVSFDIYKYEYRFYDTKSMCEHYKKHGGELGIDSMEKYLAAANRTIKNPSSLHKKEREDGDDIYYNANTGDFVIVAKAGYIRTYYSASRDYYNKQ